MPAETLDVYKEWLGIPEGPRPPDNYQLLRLVQFEDGTDKIRSNYKKLNAHVRKYATGQYSVRSQELLNELAKAMLCLTDATRKADYDISLGRKDKARGQLSLEQILMSRNLVDQAQMAKARKYATIVGCDIREAILQQKVAPPEVVMLAFAESVGRPFVDLKETGIDELVVRKVPALVARQNSCVPLMIDDDQLLMASPNLLAPDVEDDLRLRIGIPIRTVLCTAADVNAMIDKHYPKELVDAEAAQAQAPAKGKAAAAAGTKQAAAPKEKMPLSEEERRKQEILIPIIAFNMSLIGYMMWKTRMFLQAEAVGIMDFVWAILIGTGVAAVTFVVLKLRK
ncbi:MAG: general secretion pathway protein GspE [Planctomycetia bacterium]|nr:general secretion pathway protein GspE [Planctomycetia bacterium]